jgi:hypothetical protein
MNIKFITISVLTLITACTYAQEQDSTKVNPLKEVVISDTKFAQSKEKSGKVIEVISPKDLEKKSGKSLSTVLSQVTGVEINGNQSANGKNLGYYIRGGKNRQVLILIDGIPVTDASGITLEYDLRLLPVEQVESIEVMKGAASTLYGTGAATGVINITLKKGTKKTIEGFEAKFGPTVSIGVSEPTEPQLASAEVVSISTESATAYEGQLAEAEDDFDAGDDFGFVDGFAEPEPEPLPPVEDASTDPADDLIMDAVKLACTARVGSPGIIAKARENGANDTDLKHIVCLAFGMGSASRTMGDHLVLFVGKNNDPMISISETKTKTVVRTISGAELLALVRLGFGIDAPQGAKRVAAMKSAGVTV